MILDLKDLYGKLWPPYEAKMIDKEIQNRQNLAGDPAARWETIIREVAASLPDEADFDVLEATARRIEDAEDRRAETIETKGLLFASSIGIALSIVSLVSTMLSNGILSRPILLVFGAGYVLAVIHLLGGCTFAVEARTPVARAMLTADAFAEAIRNGEWRTQDRVVFALACVKWNEDLLVKKQNYVWVAQVLFLRGMFLIALVAMGIVLINLLA